MPPADTARLERALQAAHAAGDTVAATALAGELRRVSGTQAEATKPRLSDNPLKAGGQLVAGMFDVTGGGIASLAERVEGLGRGLIGVVNPNDTYHDARRRTLA